MPLRNRLEAIQKLKSPITVKGCKSFAGIIIFLNMVFPDLQGMLKPIDDLTRKGKTSGWKYKNSFMR